MALLPTASGLGRGHGRRIKVRTGRRAVDTQLR